MHVLMFLAGVKGMSWLRLLIPFTPACIIIMTSMEKHGEKYMMLHKFIVMDFTVQYGH